MHREEACSRAGIFTHHHDTIMATRLNQKAFEHARKLIGHGEIVLDDRDAWSEHKPKPSQENAFIKKHGLNEYRKWYLGIDDEKDPETKAYYKFPYGDFKKVHRCGLLTAESRAGQYKYKDIEDAAHQLHEMMEEGRVLRAG
jgi:hypothetical protein